MNTIGYNALARRNGWDAELNEPSVNFGKIRIEKSGGLNYVYVGDVKLGNDYVVGFKEHGSKRPATFYRVSGLGSK